MNGTAIKFRIKVFSFLFLFSILISSSYPRQIYGFDRISLSGYFANNSEYEKFIKEFGSAISFYQNLPAESLGLFGWDISVNLKTANIKENKSIWKNATGDGSKKTSNFLYYPQLTITKGIPCNIDLSASYSPISGAGISLISGAVKWEFIEGNTLIPAFSIRGAYSKLIKKTNFSMDDINISLSVSKGITILTPYAFTGFNRSKISSVSVIGASLKDKSENSFFYGAGVKCSAGVINFNGSAVFSDIPVYSLSASFGF